MRQRDVEPVQLGEQFVQRPSPGDDRHKEQVAGAPPEGTINDNLPADRITDNAIK